MATARPWRFNATHVVVANWSLVGLVPGAGTPPQRPPQVDGMGAGYYVIVVILVYGMSIVMLIASGIKRKHSKILEDRQINNYLKEFQVNAVLHCVATS